MYSIVGSNIKMNFGVYCFVRSLFFVGALADTVNLSDSLTIHAHLFTAHPPAHG